MSDKIEQAAEERYPIEIIPHYPVGGGSPEPFDVNEELRDAYIAGANSQQSTITTLQAENSRLKEALEKIADVDTSNIPRGVIRIAIDALKTK